MGGDRKGDKIKVDHPDIKNLFLYIIGSRGDGYDYMSSDNVEKRWGNGGWFDQMIRNPKNELFRKPISGTKKFAKGGSTYAEGGGLKDIPYGGNIPLRKGVIVKFSTGNTMRIVRAHGDGFVVQCDNDNSRSWQTTEWFNYMINSGKAFVQ